MLYNHNNELLIELREENEKLENNQFDIITLREITKKKEIENHNTSKINRKIVDAILS